jgi:hypothetical protein
VRYGRQRRRAAEQRDELAPSHLITRVVLNSASSWLGVFPRRLATMPCALPPGTRL